MSLRGLDRLVDGLPGFFESLRKQAGFGIEPAQVIAAQGLILNMAANGQLPDSLLRFKSLIGPIVCGTRRQQDEFSRRFDTWVALIDPPDVPGLSPSHPAPAVDLNRTVNEIAEKAELVWLKRARPSLVVLVISVFATVISVVLFFPHSPAAIISWPGVCRGPVQGLRV